MKTVGVSACFLATYILSASAFVIVHNSDSLVRPARPYHETARHNSGVLERAFHEGGIRKVTKPKIGSLEHGHLVAGAKEPDINDINFHSHINNSIIVMNNGSNVTSSNQSNNMNSNDNMDISNNMNISNNMDISNNMHINDSMDSNNMDRSKMDINNNVDINNNIMDISNDMDSSNVGTMNDNNNGSLNKLNRGINKLRSIKKLMKRSPKAILVSLVPELLKGFGKNIGSFLGITKAESKAFTQQQFEVLLATIQQQSTCSGAVHPRGYIVILMLPFVVCLITELKDSHGN